MFLNRRRNLLLGLSLVVFLLFFGVTSPVYADDIGINGDSSINQCETKAYFISFQNTSIEPAEHLVVTIDRSNLPGEILATSVTMNVDGGSAFCLAAPTVTSGHYTWDIDAACGLFSLTSGETLNLSFDLINLPGYNSGSIPADISYTKGSTLYTEQDHLNVTVKPGYAVIKKELTSSPAAEIGDVVSWTININSIGSGAIRNITVTDNLGAGLTYLSSNPPGVVNGQQITWNEIQDSRLAWMAAEETTSISLQAEITGATGLINRADLRWGCNENQIIQNTAADGGTAFSSFPLIQTTPVLEFTPPDISFDYGESSINQSFSITNTGDGVAENVNLVVDFGTFTVSNVSNHAIYNPIKKQFELTNAIQPGGSYTLSFNLTMPNWCGLEFPSGSLVWSPLYQDALGWDYFFPVEISSINTPVGNPNIFVDIKAADLLLEIGSQVNVVVNSGVSGLMTCSTGNMGNVSVVYTVPAGFRIVSTQDGGVWDPNDGFTGNGISGGTVTWSYVPPSALIDSLLVLSAPDIAACGFYCGQTWEHNIRADVQTCAGCSIQDSDSEQGLLTCENFGGVTAVKTISPTACVLCQAFTVTNQFDFDGSVTATLNDIHFMDKAELNQEYVPGNLSVIYNGNDITGCVNLTDTTPGGSVTLDFSGCPVDLLGGKSLSISYDMEFTASSGSTCVNKKSFTTSELGFGQDVFSCQAGGKNLSAGSLVINEPQIDVDISGLGIILSEGETKTITVSLTQLGDTDPKDVRFVLEGDSYHLVNPSAVECSGVISPISCTPTIVNGDYEWLFGDGFLASGAGAILRFDLTKRCGSDLPLTGKVYFDNHCTDDAAYDDTCVINSETAPLLLNGNVGVTLTPEVYYSAANTAQWKAYLVNRGSGTAINVWVDETLGSGLDETGIVVNNMTGITVTEDLDHEGNAINGSTIFGTALAPGERREITYDAELLNPNDLTLDISAGWNVNGMECQLQTASSSVVLLSSLLTHSVSTSSSSIIPCNTNLPITSTLQNSGQTAISDLNMNISLPLGLTFNSGSVRYRLNNGAWNGPSPAYDPSGISTSLFWSSVEIPSLALLSVGDVLEIEYTASSTCSFNGGTIIQDLEYLDPTGGVNHPVQEKFDVYLQEPDLDVRIIRSDEPFPIGGLITWQIEIENNSGYDLPVTYFTVTLDNAYNYDFSSNFSGNYAGIPAVVNGQAISWELTNLSSIAPNNKATLFLRANTDSPPCSSELGIKADAWWGCGTVDGNPSTLPGVEAGTCLNTISTQTQRTETREPVIRYLPFGLNPLGPVGYNDAAQLSIIIENPGPVDAFDTDLKVTLPKGIEYAVGGSESCQGADDSCVPVAIADPAISSSTLTFYDSSDHANDIVDQLQADGGNDTLKLLVNLQSNGCAVQANETIQFDYFYYDGCGEEQYDVSGSYPVTLIPPTLTVDQTTGIPTGTGCSIRRLFTITVDGQNAGSVANIILTETLPDGLIYQTGTTQWRVNSGVWNGPNTIYDPQVNGQVLTWSGTQISGLGTLSEIDVLEVSFETTNDCTFSGGDLVLDSTFQTICGDSLNGGSDNLTISILPSVLDISSISPSPSVPGQPYRVNVVVSGSGDTPSGEVLIDNGENTCQFTLVNGSGGCDLVSNTIGEKTITATYAGDGSQYGPANQTTSHQVTPGETIVEITGHQPQPSLTGQSYQVAVRVLAVSPAVGVPDGTVDVNDGFGNSCQISLISGSGFCDLVSESAGLKTITAVYNGNPNFNSGSGTIEHQVNPAAVTVAITGFGPQPALVEEIVQFSVQVDSVAPGTGLPGGVVELREGTEVLCSLSVSSGAGSCSAAVISTGSHTITAFYLGDNNYLPLASTPVLLTVMDFNLSQTLVSDITPYVGDFSTTGGSAPYTTTLETSGETCTQANGLGNSLFEIIDGQLFRLNTTPVGTYHICVQSEDQVGLIVQKSFQIEIVNSLDGLTLSKTSVSTNQTTIGGLSVSQGLPAYVFTLETIGAVCTAENGIDNFLFQIVGDGLQRMPTTTAGSYQICIQVVDFLGDVVQRSFVISVNESPETISLTKNTISTQQNEVGQLVVIGGQSPFQFVFSQSGAICTAENGAGNIFFALQGSDLYRLTDTPAGSYQICLTAADANNEEIQQSFLIVVSEPPSDIMLNETSVTRPLEMIGLLSTRDGLPQFSYQLLNAGSICGVGGTGDGNDRFYLYDDWLVRKTNTLAGIYSICVQTTDANREIFQKTFEITVEAEDPFMDVDFALSSDFLIHGSTPGTVVGEFITTQSGMLYQFSTVLPDESAFLISGSRLLLNTTVDINLQDQYAIRVKAVTNDGFAVTKDFWIQVKANGVIVGAEGMNDQVSVSAGGQISIPVLENDLLSVGATHWVVLDLVTIPGHGLAVVESTNNNAFWTILYQADTGFDGADSLTYRACDNLGNCISATVLITVIQIEKITFLPETGFTPGIKTVLPLQPVDKTYQVLGDLWVELPTLGVRAEITGVPLDKQTWDVTWLGEKIGWLEGSAYPGLDGNTVLTGHYTDSLGLHGVFARLGELRWGDEIIVHAWGAEYVYVVRTVQAYVLPANSAVLSHEETPWLTLITCRGYNKALDQYDWRTVVRAVLVEIR